MKITPYKTKLVAVGEDLFDILDTYLPALQEKSVVAVTSKLISFCEGSVAEKTISKETLIEQEADFYLDALNPHGVILTVKNGILIPNAGIDESNAADLYILYPKDLFGKARLIWEFLKKRDSLQNLGIIITDSHTTPLRWGVTGIGISWCGFAPLNSYIGTPDCYGRHLRFTKVNVVDALAVSAVFVMGEGNEQTPLAVLEEVAKVTFVAHPPSLEEQKSFQIPMEQDLYGPLLQHAKWRKKK